MDTELLLQKNLTIQEVAAHCGLSVHTLRYYEKIGLLDSIRRASSGHRRYNINDMNWLAFLIRLRSTGMSIQQMLTFATLRRQGPCSIPQRLALLEEHQRQVLTHIQELEGHLAVIERKIAIHREDLHGQTLPDRSFPEHSQSF